MVECWLVGLTVKSVVQIHLGGILVSRLVCKISGPDEYWLIGASVKSVVQIHCGGILVSSLTVKLVVQIHRG